MNLNKSRPFTCLRMWRSIEEYLSLIPRNTLFKFKFSPLFARRLSIFSGSTMSLLNSSFSQGIKLSTLSILNLLLYALAIRYSIPPIWCLCCTKHIFTFLLSSLKDNLIAIQEQIAIWAYYVASQRIGALGLI